MAKFDDRCANCGGKFGLVCHRHWRLRFCSKVCKTNFLAKNNQGLCGHEKVVWLTSSRGDEEPASYVAGQW